MKFNKLLFAVLMLATCSINVHANEITGRVVGVSDGDTLTVLDDTNTQYKVRLAEIDAPEKAQAFGQASKKSLSDICYNKQAVVNFNEKDRYGRIVGKVECEGINANKSQLGRGLAWVYLKYNKDPHNIELQHYARVNKKGLWIDSYQVEPWNFRKGER